MCPVNERQHNNGRITPRADHTHAVTSSTLRHRSPGVYWTAILVAVAMGASAIGTFLYLVL